MIDSIRIRLTLWYVGVLALIVISFAGLTYFLVAQIITQETDETLEDLGRNFTTTVQAEYQEKLQRTTPDRISPEKVLAEIIEESRFHDYTISVFDTSFRPVVSTIEDVEMNMRLIRETDRDLQIETPEGRKNFRVRRSSFVLKDTEFNLVVTHATDDQDKLLFRVRSGLFLAVPLLLLLAGVSGYFLARKSLAPVVEMSRRAAGIGAANLHERLPVENEKDELGHLAQVFNALLVRLENSFEQQRRFMADASHELRTPLAIVRGESEVALSKSDRPNEELRESLAIVHDESRRLTRIVEDLFTLARADAGHFNIAPAKIYLDELLADSVRAVQVLAGKRDVRVELETLPEMPFDGDERLLQQLFRNLLDNAIKYNIPGGKVSVDGTKTEAGYQLRFTDTGEGISVADRAKVFERFYRADKARTRDRETLTSGSGLGLSIALWIAEMHHGTIEIVSSDQSGSVFAVLLP